MKTQTGIWLNTEKAIIIDIINGKENILEIPSCVETRVRYEGDNPGSHKQGGRPDSFITKTEERKKHQYSIYFQSIIDKIKNSDEILIFGPAETKTKFSKEIENTSQLFHKIKSIQTCDKLTERQLVAFVKNYFKALV